MKTILIILTSLLTIFIIIKIIINLRTKDNGYKFKEILERDNKLQLKEIQFLENQNQLQKELIEIQKHKRNLIVELEKASSLSIDEATKKLIQHVKEKHSVELTEVLKELELETKLKSDEISNSILIDAMSRNSKGVVKHATVNIIKMLNPDLRGRIIGKAGRNIRVIEEKTGVDIILDNSSDVIQVSCFNPIRREIAKRTIESLMQDGRIHPESIEAEVEKQTKLINEITIQAGKKTVKELGIKNISQEMVERIGILKFRTSFGQNALLHSIETAKIAGALAVQFGQDQNLAIRAGLLHDIGKTLDIEEKGSHVELGAKLAKLNGEHEIVINAIECHHGNKEPISLISKLVTIADGISASRPGARQNNVSEYIERVKEIEEIATKNNSVEQAYAMKGGRELRVFVKPSLVSEESAEQLAMIIKESIEEKIKFPGIIKITVIRENRFSVEAVQPK